jgi:transcriptional regulator with XRE-family HTH domain
VSVRRGPKDLGSDDAARLVERIGSELRSTRIALGHSQRFVAGAAGTSPSRLGRIERGEVRDPSLAVICRVARVLGLSLSLQLYPAGSPARDAGQLRLIDRFAAILARPLGLRREVVLPGHGELRAWDAHVTAPDGVAAMDAEVRLGDVQALERRLRAKLRDDPRVVVLILVVARTRHNVEVLSRHREALRDLLPLDSATILRALRAGRLPPASGILVV